MNKLVLYARDPLNPEVALDQLLTVLRRIGFIDREIDTAGARRYRPGSAFTTLLDFRPDSGRRPHCSVEFPEVLEEVEFLTGSSTSTPACPCGAAVNGWEKAIGKWESAKETFRWSCPECGSQRRLSELDWKRTAAFGRHTIDVHDIDLGEAVPRPELTHALQESTAAVWDYYYQAG